LRGGPDFRGLVADFEQALGRQRRRLLHEINRARIERRQHLRPGLGRDADDHDRHRPPRHLRAHERQAVQDRHVEVAGNHIGLELFHELERLRAVARRPHHVDERAAGEHLRHDLADVGRIVDHQYADDVRHGRPLLIWASSFNAYERAADLLEVERRIDLQQRLRGAETEITWAAWPARTG
jgi:hypothetical protein